MVSSLVGSLKQSLDTGQHITKLNSRGLDMLFWGKFWKVSKIKIKVERDEVSIFEGNLAHVQVMKMLLGKFLSLIGIGRDPS
jgi:hypothetical protein